MASGSSRVAALIDRYDAAWNAQALDAIAAMHDDAIVFHNHTADERVAGAAAVREHIAAGELPEPPEPPEPPVPDDELPHAAITSVAATAPTGTSHLFRMTCLRSDEFSLILIPRSARPVRSRMVHVRRR